MEYKNENRICQNCKQTFIIEPDDFLFYEKMRVPPPTFCPECRFKMRSLWRNETTLYSGQKCGLCDKSIISMYNPKSPHTIYCHDCFVSDKWNARDYAIDFDENKSFLEQFKRLILRVPKDALFITNTIASNVNSPFINMAGGCKNCYMFFNGGPCQDVLYAKGVKDSEDSIDLYFGVGMNQCYEGVNVLNSYKVFYGQNVVSCVDSMFLFNCRNLTNCFGCVNLINKSYCWFNEQLDQEEYNLRLSEILGNSEAIEKTKKEFENFVKKFPHRENNNIQTIGSEGDYLFGCKNVRNSFEIANAENVKNAIFAKEAKDSMDIIGYGFKSQNLLECVGVGYADNVISSAYVDNSFNIMYSLSLKNCSDCIGCDSLRNMKYCILNKEYEKKEYERLKNLIYKELKEKKLLGLMITAEFAPFAYNEVIGQDNLVMTKEEVVAQGFRWEDDLQKTTGKETLKPEQIPNHIKDVQDSIMQEVLSCTDCGRNYKLTEAEFIFYKRMLLPIPRKCFYCRHQARIKKRGPYKFWERVCNKCKKEITTNYAPDRPEIVYCEDCYKKEIY